MFLNNVVYIQILLNRSLSFGSYDLICKYNCIHLKKRTKILQYFGMVVFIFSIFALLYIYIPEKPVTLYYNSNDLYYVVTQCELGNIRHIILTFPVYKLLQQIVGMIFSLDYFTTLVLKYRDKIIVRTILIIAYIFITVQWCFTSQFYRIMDDGIRPSNQTSGLVHYWSF